MTSTEQKARPFAEMSLEWLMGRIAQGVLNLDTEKRRGVHDVMTELGHRGLPELLDALEEIVKRTPFLPAASGITFNLGLPQVRRLQAVVDRAKGEA